MKFFNSHISAAEIADAIDGIAGADGENKVKAHLSTCAHCQTEFASFSKAIGLMRRDDSADAPFEAIQFAKNIYRTRVAFNPQSATNLQKIMATLKLNVAPFAPSFGERSASASSERQMLFEAGEFDLDLRIRPAENAFNLIGQLLGDVHGKGTLRLEGNVFTQENSLNEQGEFSFKLVPAGTYNLQLRIGGKEILITDLVIE